MPVVVVVCCVIELLQQVIDVVFMFLPECEIALLISPRESYTLQDVLQGHQADERVPLPWPAEHREMLSQS